MPSALSRFGSVRPRSGRPSIACRRRATLRHEPRRPPVKDLVHLIRVGLANCSRARRLRVALATAPRPVLGRRDVQPIESGEHVVSASSRRSSPSRRPAACRAGGRFDTARRSNTRGGGFRRVCLAATRTSTGWPAGARGRRRQPLMLATRPRAGGMRSHPETDAYYFARRRVPSMPFVAGRVSPPPSSARTAASRTAGCAHADLHTRWRTASGPDVQHPGSPRCSVCTSSSGSAQADSTGRQATGFLRTADTWAKAAPFAEPFVGDERFAARSSPSTFSPTSRRDLVTLRPTGSSTPTYRALGRNQLRVACTPGRAGRRSRLTSCITTFVEHL